MFFFIIACIGRSCRSKCPQGYYGEHCNQSCPCDADQCDDVSGCMSSGKWMHKISPSLFSTEPNTFLLEKRPFIVKTTYCFYTFVIYDLLHNVGRFFSEAVRYVFFLYLCIINMMQMVLIFNCLIIFMWNNWVFNSIRNLFRHFYFSNPY